MAAFPVTLEPTKISVPAAGGSANLLLTNASTEIRYSFKCKSTNNDFYRVNPVYGFVESGTSTQVEVLRLNGPPKSDDRMEILLAPVDPDINDPRTSFQDGTVAAHRFDVPLDAV
ncbi:MSP domain-containing protein [Meloidogyne graminicola]|uniref:MSP domain-containing protein n=1 Tax=Meloidogyne graminicola TaxID=189291 RepID=A0A8S9ZSC5_9BILA|nr:MSP domain-containing protein [Meloidogyne graminicola]KAF7636397.1 MSP domain-containing protein [Meloidogyne graminicola]